MGFSDWLGSVVEDVGGGVSDFVGGAMDFLPSFTGGASSSSSNTGGGFSIGGLLKDPAVLSSLITTGGGLLSGLSGLDLKEEELARAREDEKFKYLLELAKLKYGAHGGGGAKAPGSLRNKNADLIEVLSAGTDDKLRALDQMAKSYIGALG